MWLSTDRGATWTSDTIATQQSLQNVAIKPNGEVVVVGSGGTIFRNDSALSVRELQGNMRRQPFANPVSEWLTIENSDRSIGRIVIRTLLGENILDESVKSGSSRFDIRTFPVGFYSVSCFDRSGIFLRSWKLLKYQK